jgi:16S rRNA (adenine1518-N6/adenine1519-N6)-dimethyltransferase
MDLTKPTDLKALLQRHGLHLSKRFGQNFLTDRHHLMRVVETAGIGPDDAVFEIGPGVGTLTVELAQRARRIVSVELDRGVVPVLRDVVSAYPHVTVVEADALRLDLSVVLPETLGPPPYKVAANIPYNITSPLLVRLLENKRLFTSITLMVQKEVAERLSAHPGDSAYGSLTVFAQYHADVSMHGVVPAGAFFPPPRVDSAILHLIPRASAPVTVGSEIAFFAVSRSAFGQRRKTLQNALTNAPQLAFTRDQIIVALHAAGVDGGRRGETLSLAELAAVTNALPFDSATLEAVYSSSDAPASLDA